MKLPFYQTIYYYQYHRLRSPAACYPVMSINYSVTTVKLFWKKKKKCLNSGSSLQGSFIGSCCILFYCEIVGRY